MYLTNLKNPQKRHDGRAQEKDLGILQEILVAIPLMTGQTHARATRVLTTSVVVAAAAAVAAAFAVIFPFVHFVDVVHISSARGRKGRVDRDFAALANEKLEAETPNGEGTNEQQHVDEVVAVPDVVEEQLDARSADHHPQALGVADHV